MKPAQHISHPHTHTIWHHSVIMAPTKSSYTKSMSPLSAGGLSCSVTAQSAIPLCVRSLLRYPWCCQCLACALYVSRLAVNKLSECSPLLLDLGGGQRATSTKLSPTVSWAKWLPTVSKKEKKKANEMQPENRGKTMRRMLMTLCFDCKVNSTKARVPLSIRSPPSSHDTQCCWFRIFGIKAPGITGDI